MSRGPMFRNASPLGATILVALLLACSSCQREAPQVQAASQPESQAPVEATAEVTSYLPDGGPGADAIVADIEKELGALSRGIADNDAEAIFSIFSTDKQTTYVRDGVVEESVAAARARYAEELSRLTSKRSFTFERKQYDVIDERTVLFTGVGVLIGTTADAAPWRIAYTILWLREPAGWKAISMHISWKA